MARRAGAGYSRAMRTCDFLIVGGGIAGAAAAHALAEHGAVALLEREARPGYHSTGRSAATLTENYGPPVIRRLVKAARPFLENPPDGFSQAPLLGPRGALFIAPADGKAAIDAALAEARKTAPDIRAISAREIRDLVPVLRPEAAVHALYEEDCRDIDVAGLHQGFLKGLKARGGALVGGAEVHGLTRRDGLWHAETKAGVFAAPVAVNAAGAWVDGVAEMAGLGPLGFTPKRRSVFTCDPPAGLATARWPLVIAHDESLYFKPDAGRLLVSPADATPSAPCDAQPEEIDIAIAADRFMTVTTLEVRHIPHRWAGLRTFAPDGDPVAGFDPRAEGFFWLAGQGGYGIKTAEPLGRCAAALIVDGALPASFENAGITAAGLAPDRLPAAAAA